MGGGKSRIVVDYIQNTAQPDFRVLLVCPNKAVSNVWPEEFLTYAAPSFQYRLLLLHDMPIPERAQLLSSQIKSTDHSALVTIVNYEAAILLPLSKLLLSTAWHIVIMDESHRIKSPGGSQSRFMAKLCAKAPKILALSGTPMPQGPVDIYAQARAIAPSVFGTRFDTFQAQYCVMGPSGKNPTTGKPFPAFLSHVIQNYKNMADFDARLASFCFHVEPSVVEESLPDFTDITITTPLPPDIQAAYNALETEMCAELDGQFLSVDNALVKQLRLAQLTAGHWWTPESNLSSQVHTAKVDAALELLTDSDPAEQWVIFARFRAEILSLKTAVRDRVGRPVFLLMGGADELSQWKPTKGAVLIVQIAAGAEAVSFVEARYQIYSTVTWSYSQYEQSRRRIRRHGQDRPVTYYHLIAPHTVDEDAHAALRRKANVIEAVRDGIRARARRTNPQD
jgi:hypothetical protein